MVPPAAILIAAKLVRGDDRDIDNCAYLVAAKRIELDDVRNAIAKLPNRAARETAKDNLVFLSIMEDDLNTGPGRLPD